jgi:hypothetical protein
MGFGLGGGVQVLQRNILEALVEKKAGTAGGASSGFDFSSVPSGEIWEIYAISQLNATNAYGFGIFLKVGGVEHIITCQPNAAIGAGTSVLTNIAAYLNPTDQLNVMFYGCTAGDTISAYIFGRKYQQ